MHANGLQKTKCSLSLSLSLSANLFFRKARILLSHGSSQTTANKANILDSSQTRTRTIIHSHFKPEKETRANRRRDTQQNSGKEATTASKSTDRCKEKRSGQQDLKGEKEKTGNSSSGSNQSPACFGNKWCRRKPRRRRMQTAAAALKTASAASETSNVRKRQRAGFLGTQTMRSFVTKSPEVGRRRKKSGNRHQTTKPPPGRLASGSAWDPQGPVRCNVESGSSNLATKSDEDLHFGSLDRLLSHKLSRFSW